MHKKELESLIDHLTGPGWKEKSQMKTRIRRLIKVIGSVLEEDVNKACHSRLSARLPESRVSWTIEVFRERREIKFLIRYWADGKVVYEYDRDQEKPPKLPWAHLRAMEASLPDLMEAACERFPNTTWG